MSLVSIAVYTVDTRPEQFPEVNFLGLITVTKGPL
jgi:hypothetical protein